MNALDKEAIGNNETFKRQRRWNAENAKALEPQKSNLSGSYVLKDVVQPTSKHTLTGPDKTISEDSPKERIGEHRKSTLFFFGLYDYFLLKGSFLVYILQYLPHRGLPQLP